MSVLRRVKIKGQVKVNNLIYAFDLMGMTIHPNSTVTLETGPQLVDLHIPAEALTKIGFGQGRNEAYGLGINQMEDGVEMIFDRYYAPQQSSLVQDFLPGLNKLGESHQQMSALVAAGNQINAFFDSEEEVLRIQLVPQNAGAESANVFAADNGADGVWQ